MLEDRFGVAEKTRIRLDGEAAVAPGMGRERRLEKLRGSDRHLFDQRPPDPILGRAREVMEQGLDARPPDRDFLLQDADGDDGVAGSSDGAVLDRVDELADVGRVVPQHRRRRLRHLMQPALVRHPRHRWICGRQLGLHSTCVTNA